MKKLGGALLFVLLLAVPMSAQTVSGRVTLQADDSAVPGVTVSIEGLGMTTVTDADGRYSLTVPSGRAAGTVRVTANLQGFTTRAASVDLRADATQDFVLRVSFGQEITVGSRAIGAAEEKAVPVDVITQEMIRSSPSTETNQIIQKMAPSFNFPRPTITDGSDSVRPATLRGLGPDQLLVMLNGKRRHASALVNANNSIGRGSSGVDLNAIPAVAIQNVEILRDGAAAQYGSDAIAGVINLVLKSDPQPLQIDLKTGMTTHGDGEMLDTTVSGGWGIGRGALVVAGEYRVRYETNRANPDKFRDQIVAGDAGNNAVEQPNTHWGDSYARDWIVFSNFNLPVSADSKQVFYAFGGYSNRHGSHGGNYRRALQNENWRQIYPLGFLPLIEPRVTDASLASGLRGEMASWFYDLSLGYGQNEMAFYVTNSLNSSLGPTSQTSFYAGTLEDALITTNLDVSRQFNVGMAGPLNVAWGLEYRKDSWQETAGEPNSYINGGVRSQNNTNPLPGAQVFPGYQPANEVDVSRNGKAIYFDLEGDVLSKLRLGVAARFEDFSDFGNTTNGKLTARYSPIQQLILRGSVSTGFRAPSLSQGNWSAISTNFIVNPATSQVEAFQVGTYRIGSPIADALGAPALKPENSKNLSGGVVWQPLSNFEITADYFHIEIDDRIVYTGNFNQPAIQAIILPLGANGARFLTNAINTETNGYDLVANYQRPLFTGRMDLSAAYSNNNTEIVGTVATPGRLAGFGETLFDRQERRRVECGQPKDSIRLMQSFTTGGLNLTTRESRYGEYCSLTSDIRDDQTFPAEWIADAEVSYRWGKYTAAIGAENIFDNLPDRNRVFRTGSATQFAQQSGAGGTNAYPSHSPFGMNGTFVYTRVGYTF